MERVNKALLVLTVVTALLVAVSMEAVEGARVLKSVDQKQEQVDHPETFYGGIVGGSYPGGFSGVGFGPNGFYTIPGSGGAGGGTVSGLPDISNPPSLGATKP